MRELISNLKRQTARRGSALRDSFHRVNAKLLWALGVVGLIFVPVAVVGWQGHDDASMSMPAVAEPGGEESLSSTPAKNPTKKEADSVESSTTFQTNVQSNGTGTPDTTTHVEVNGRTIPTPKNGSVHKIIHNADGKTTVDISTRSNSSSSADSFSSTDIQMNSDTYSASDRSQ